MPFLDCPTCRLTVRLRNTEALLGRPCPRCGDRLGGSPHSMIMTDAQIGPRSRLGPADRDDGPLPSSRVV
jgi:hypothetical protein